MIEEKNYSCVLFVPVKRLNQSLSYYQYTNHTPFFEALSFFFLRLVDGLRRLEGDDRAIAMSSVIPLRPKEKMLQHSIVVPLRAPLVPHTKKNASPLQYTHLT